MTTETKLQMIATKKTVRFVSIQAVARTGYRQLLKHPHLEYKTIEGQRIRRAVQQLMELADGEKEWVKSLRKDLQDWKQNGYSYFKIPLGLNCTRGGFRKKRGEMYCYGIRVEYHPSYRDLTAHNTIKFENMLRSDYTVGD